MSSSLLEYHNKIKQINDLAYSLTAFNPFRPLYHEHVLMYHHYDNNANQYNKTPVYQFKLVDKLNDLVITEIVKQFNFNWFIDNNTISFYSK